MGPDLFFRLSEKLFPQTLICLSTLYRRTYSESNSFKHHLLQKEFEEPVNTRENHKIKHIHVCCYHYPEIDYFPITAHS